MSAPVKGSGEQILRTSVSSFSYVLNLSTFILKSDKKTENTIFVSFKVLEVVLGFGFPHPPRYNLKPERRLSGSSDILLSIYNFSNSFGGGKR